MEEGKKKIVVIGGIVVSLIVAGVIFYSSGSDSSGPTPSSLMLWMKCRECNETYQLSFKDFMEDKPPEPADGSIAIPVLVCKKCDAQSAYQAMQCEKCEAVFEKNAVPGKRPDTCPECGYSKMQEARERAIEARRKKRNAQQQQ